MAKQRGPSRKGKTVTNRAKKPAAAPAPKKQSPTASLKSIATKSKRANVVSKGPKRTVTHPTAKRVTSTISKLNGKTSKPAAKPSSVKVSAPAKVAVASAKKQPSSNGHAVKTPSPQTARVAAAARRTVAQRKIPVDAIDRRKLAVPSQNGHSDKNKAKQDRIVTMVRDPFWLHVYWEITPESIQRTEAALGPDWYTSKPVLRVLDVSSEDTTSAAESVLRDIPIHGGVNNWYLDIDGTQRSYRVDVGYLTAKGRFFALARSNMVTPPKPGSSDNVDGHWNSVREECDKIFAMSGGTDPQNNSDKLQKFFEERFGRPMSAGSLTNYGSGALSGSRRQQFHFDLDAELIVHGRTVTDARVIVHGEPVQLRKDGSFTLRLSLPDGRQILPATAATNDGIEERTVIIAIERNTKVLEPMIHDGQE